MRNGKDSNDANEWRVDSLLNKSLSRWFAIGDMRQREYTWSSQAKTSRISIRYHYSLNETVGIGGWMSGREKGS